MAVDSSIGQAGLRGRAALVGAYGAAVFSAGLLVFAIQPLIAKFVLPRFGGGSDVWTACMLFFQAGLLAGYAYGHLSADRLRWGLQAVVHGVVLLAAAAMLPIRPAMSWADGVPPVAGVLGVLAVSVGLPYIALASSSPLLQSWFSRTAGLGSPYRLYALSNAGSLLAVIGYPFVIEPWLSRQGQMRAWSWGMGLLIVLECCLIVAVLRRASKARRGSKQPAPPQRGDPAPPLSDQLLWIALAAGASVVLLAATNTICQDVAPIPLLWLAPLCVYLLSFVVCFHGERWYARRVWLGLFMIALVAVVIVDRGRYQLPILAQIGVYLAALAACCMVCHGEVYRLRPPPRLLTRYYLSIALGGCCGGFLVAVVAPLVFRRYVELYLGLAASCAFVLLADKSLSALQRRRRWVYVVGIVAACILAAALPRRGKGDDRMVVSRRNFYGVVSIWEEHPDDPTRCLRILMHGGTVHGWQYTRADRHGWATAYYGHASGMGMALDRLPQRPRRIGVVGLGVGTVAAYGREGDTIRFYEINPIVRDMARTYFTYLSDARAIGSEVDVVMGDARLSLEREPDQDYDLLVLDAFSGDTVPLHLLTTGAFETYLRHLNPHGVLAVHASVMHVDVRLVVMRLAEHFGLISYCLRDEGDPDQGTLPSTWVLLGRRGSLIEDEAIRQAAQPPPANLDRVALWTDDYVNPLQLLH
jgi:hypothetical protein